MRLLLHWNLRLFDKKLIHREVQGGKGVKLFLPYLLVKWVSILFLPLLLPGCESGDEVFRQESFVFGTRVEISIAGADQTKAEAAAQTVLQRFDALHRKLHAWQPSELDQLNSAFAAGKKQPVGVELAAILLDAQAFSIQSSAQEFSSQGDGLFNPAIGNLIRLWGFQADLPQTQIPDKSAIATLVKAAPSLRNVHVENGMAWSDNPAARIDLGGYAKGYALDEAAALLKRQGIHNALINIGGNVLALGEHTLGLHGKRPWKVGIQHPRKSGIIATLELTDGEAVGTSGDYQRYFESGGLRYCHLIDPRTGYPANGMQSVTILTAGKHAGVKSDTLTKPLFITGAAGLAPMLHKLQVTQVLAVTSNGSVLVSPAMQRRLQWGDPKQRFQLVR